MAMSPQGQKGAEMEQVSEMLRRYSHRAEEYPFLSRQTHRIVKDGRTVSEPININENIMHYVQDTALLISRIDGSVELFLL